MVLVWLWVSEGFVEYGEDERIWMAEEGRGGGAGERLESEVCE